MSGPLSPGPALFERFTQAQTCKETRVSFVQLCRHLQLDPGEHQQLFYSRLQERLNHWKAKELWQKINSRAAHPLYQRGGACRHNQVLVVGAGPCGLRVAVELALLGARVLLLDKRSSFNRNNVLHLWPYTIRDLRSLGAKHFYGRFCSGSLDHISIRQLQLILLKLALVLGVELHTGVTYHALLEPTGNTGWRAEVSPKSHEVASFQFDVFISAAGGRFVPEGFRIKELRGKLAIGITANFVNRRTKEEAQVQEISGVARIYNQKFFQELQSQKGVDLENIVYYRDDTHYFVMTAKKASLLKRGVIKQDFSDAVQLLSPSNVDPEALMHYAYDAADFSTQEMLPDLEFARNHAAQPDVAMFDFTSMHRAENASLVRERSGKKLLIGLVGDSLVEPFWPLGTGIARGFFGAFDAAWMVRRWGMGVAPLELLAERESVYQLLSQTTPENTSKNYAAYSLDPATRYPNLNPASIKPRQVQRLYSTCEGVSSLKKPVLKAKPRSDSVRRVEELLSWCQRSTRGYEGVSVTDLSESWRCGRALCALIHHFRPALIDPAALDLSDPTRNHQLAFDLMEKEFGITPVTRASDMSRVDQLTMMIYLTQIRHALAQTHQPTGGSEQSRSLSRTRSAVVFINQLNHDTLQRRKERQATLKRPRTRAMEEQEEEKVKEEAPPPQAPPSDSERCCFCQERLYVLERESAEGKFFHRSCFTCHCCRATLRHGGYTYHTHTGRFYCELHSETEEEDDDGHKDSQMAAEGGAEGGADTQGGSPARHASVRRKSSYKISVDPECVELLPEDPPTLVPAPSPVPAPRGSRCRADDPPPLPKPRTVHNVTEPRPEVATPCRYLLQLSGEEEKSEDSDSDTPLSRYWSGARSLRDQRNRRCQNRRSESLQDNARVRSKFSPWNLSSPRPQPRPTPTGHQRSEDEEEEEDEALHAGDHFLDCGEAEFVLSESEKAELRRMKTLERKAKMREFNRFHKAQAIQRRLDEIEVTFKDLEEKGVELERELRADAGSGDPETIDRWIGLVHQKNALLSEESDLMVASRQLELEDKQSMLEMELRRYMEMDDAEKSPAQREHEQQVLQEKLDVVDMRDSLVAFLEEKRLKEISEVWG